MGSTAVVCERPWLFKAVQGCPRLLIFRQPPILLHVRHVIDKDLSFAGPSTIQLTSRGQIIFLLFPFPTNQHSLWLLF